MIEIRIDYRIIIIITVALIGNLSVQVDRLVDFAVGPLIEGDAPSGQTVGNEDRFKIIRNVFYQIETIVNEEGVEIDAIPSPSPSIYKQGLPCSSGTCNFHTC